MKEINPQKTDFTKYPEIFEKFKEFAKEKNLSIARDTLQGYGLFWYVKTQEAWENFLFINLDKP